MLASVSFVYADSLAAYWKFDESSGPAFDSSGNNNVGSLTNGATRFVGAQAGNKLQLDGINDYMSVPDSDSIDFGTGNFSIALWIHIDSTAGTRSLVAKQDAASRAGYALFLDAGRLAMQGRDVSSAVRYAETGTTVLAPNTWYFVVGVGDRANGYRLYINGVPETTTRMNTLAAQDDSLSTSATLTVGANLNTGNYTAGRFDNVRLYNYALSPAEISALYQGNTTPPATGPNIVVIMTDDQDVASLSVMPKTKALLQDQGITFQNSFVDFPVCCPSRSSFLTGQSAHNHGVLGNEPATDGGYVAFKPSEGNALPVWLQSAGYVTAFVGKYLNGYGNADAGGAMHVPPGWGFWRGLIDPLGTYQFYDYSINENGTIRAYGTSALDYQTDVLAQKAADFITSRNGSPQPFFMWVTPLAPHIVKKSFYGSSPEPAPRHDGMFAGVPLPQPPSYNEADMSDKPLFMQQHPLVDIAQATNLFRDRRESLLAVDDLVEKVVGALQAAGKLDNTIVVFTSDNGYSHGEHRRNNNKYLAYEESIRVPLIIRGPGVAKNQTRSQMVTNLDVVATIEEMAKAAPGRVPDGRSLAPLFNNAAAPWRTAFLLQGADQSGLDPKVFSGRYQAVRTGTSIYIEHTTGERELYDLTRDSYELASLHNDSTYTTLKTTLKSILDALRTCAGASCWYSGDVVAPEAPAYPAVPAPPSMRAVGDVAGSQPSVLQNCPNISRRLSFGSRGRDVARMQSYLIVLGYLAAGNDTGYFGPLTEEAVKKFQCAERIVCSGTLLTTGYGVVGPLTRTALNRCTLPPVAQIFDY